jgi:hypothetical protein
MPKRSARSTRRIEITSTADRHMLEAFQLEVRRLAREHGFEVTHVRIAEAEDQRPRRTT